MGFAFLFGAIQSFDLQFSTVIYAEETKKTSWHISKSENVPMAPMPDVHMTSTRLIDMC